MHSVIVFARKALIALLVMAAVPVVGGVASIATADRAAAVVATSITVRGNQRVDASTIRQYLTIKVGSNYSAVDLDNSSKALFNTGLFADVSVVGTNGGAVVLVTVIEAPIVNSVVFQGNNKIKSDQLQAVISVKQRGVLTDAKLQTDVLRIREYYASQGRGSAVVTPQVTRLSDNRADVVFQVNEGGRTGVTAIEFVGNNAFPSGRLRSVITTRKTSWLSWLNKRDIYSDERLDADQAALRRFYLERGYADFQVLSADAVQGDGGNYHVTFTLAEGPKYTFGPVNVDSSIPGVNANALGGSIKTKSGQLFNATDVEASVENLTIELSRLGYVFAQVRPRGDRDYNNHIVSITYVIDEGPRAYIERIEIRGNTKTRDYVIRREFDIAEGDAYNRVLIDKAQRRLRNLGYFKSVNISPQQGSAPDRVVLLVQVEDQSTGSFSVAGGVSSTEGLIAEVSLSESNFLGRGQSVKVAVSGGKNDRSYNLSFTDPYFLGYRVSAGFDLYRNVSKPTSTRPFSNVSTGGDLRVGLPLNDQWRADLNYRFDNSVRSGPNTAACTVPTVAGCYFPNGTRVTSSAGYSVTYSTIDSYVDPHEGLYLRLGQDFAGLGGTANYMRSTGDARVYVPLGTKTDIVGLVRAQGGNITGLGGSTVAVTDNFFRGGETVRGFANLGYGPRDTTNGPNGIALGGKTYGVVTAEVQFPIPFLPPDLGFKAAVFGDAGVLFGVDVPSACTGVCTTSPVNDTTVRASVGGSIIWASPFGPLRLDVARALNKANYDQTQLIRFGAGASF